MQRPFEQALPVKSAASRLRMAGVLAMVAAIEASFVFLLISGLGAKIVHALPTTVVAEVLKPEPPKPAPPPPQPQLQIPQEAAVPPPMIQIQAPPRATNPITVVVANRPVAPAPIEVAKPAPATPPTAASAIASTHTIPPYPELARRLAQQGTVTLSLSIGPDGSVSDATLAQSSGSNQLDQAAIEWVRSHWRYHPATQNGKPVATTSQARIVFDLRQAANGW